MRLLRVGTVGILHICHFIFFNTYCSKNKSMVALCDARTAVA